MYVAPVFPRGHCGKRIFVDDGSCRIECRELRSLGLRGWRESGHGVGAVLLVHRAGVDGWGRRRSGMRLSVGVHGRRRSIWRRIRRGGIALDALMASSTTAAAAACAASKAAARALGAAAYASRYAGNHRYDDEGANDDYDDNRPSVVCEQRGSSLRPGDSTHLQ